MQILSSLLFATLLLCLASTAGAVDHWQACNLAHEAGTAQTGSRLKLVSTISDGAGAFKSLCYDTDGTTDSPLLDITNCDQIDVEIFDMTDGTIAGTGNWMTCPTDAVTNCALVGTALSTSNQSHQGRGQNYGFVDGIVNAGTKDLRFAVRCNGG